MALITFLAISGASYQAIQQRADARRFPEVGKRIDVDGHRLNINCLGQGSPTVILEAGLGDSSLEWRQVQPRIAQFARVCSYDRAGYGWSDPGPMPRTSRRIAGELHALLQHAHENPPFLMVGHSFGGYCVRVFNGQYSQQVSGLVLVDSTQEDQYTLLPESWKKLAAEQLHRYQKQARFARLYVGLGLARLTLLSEVQQFGAAHLDPTAYLILRPTYLQTRASELEYIRESAQEAHNAGSVDDKPLIVLTAGRNDDPVLAGGMGAQGMAEFNRIWAGDLQMRLVHLSTRGKQAVVSDSGHDIPSERPDAVVAAVHEIIEEAAQR